MNSDKIQKITNFCQKFPNHDVVKFYQKYTQLELSKLTEDDLSKSMNDKRLGKILNQVSDLIDDVFRNTILPLEVEDMFLILIESEINFSLDFNFDKNLYTLKLNKSTDSPITDMNLIFSELNKISEKFKDKKLILSILESNTKNSETLTHIDIKLNLCDKKITEEKKKEKNDDNEERLKQEMLLRYLEIRHDGREAINVRRNSWGCDDGGYEIQYNDGSRIRI